MNTYFTCIYCGHILYQVQKECPKCHKSFLVEIDKDTQLVIAKYKNGEKE